MGMKLPTGIGHRLIRHRLSRCTSTIQELREDLRVCVEQLDVMRDEAHDAGLRAIVSETPLAEAVSRDARAHHDAMQRHVDHLRESIARLEAEQDDLLDELNGLDD